MDWQHLSDRTLEARKIHQCLLCERPIGVGEVHVNRTGVRDAEIQSFRMHAACKARTHLWDEHDWALHDVAEFRRMIDGGPEVEEPDWPADEGDAP